jgi:hypothetical protein
MKSRNFYPGLQHKKEIPAPEPIGFASGSEERFSLGGAAHDLSARASGRDPRR